MESAAELFARANLLRRRDEVSEAASVYRDLQRSFPGSAESFFLGLFWAACCSIGWATGQPHSHNSKVILPPLRKARCARKPSSDAPWRSRAWSCCPKSGMHGTRCSMLFRGRPPPLGRARASLRWQRREPSSASLRLSDISRAPIVKARHLFVLIVFVSARARAGDAVRPSETRTTPEERRVLLVVAAEPAETEQLRQVAAELLGRLSVSVRADRVDRIDVEDLARSLPPRSGYLARVYIDLREPNRATLWFVDPAHDRILMRQLERVPAGDELLREELGHILETSTEGLLAGEEIGLPRASVLPMVKAKESAPQDVAPASTAKPLMQFALLYEVQGLSSQAPLTHGPESSAYLAIPPRRGAFGIWLTGQYRFPVDVETGPVGARIEGGALRAMLTFDWVAASRVTLRGALGGGADIVRLNPESLGGSGVALADARLLAFAMVRAGLGLEFRVSSILSVWSRVAVDFDAAGTRYVFEGHQGEQLVLSPWMLRPAFALGAGFP